MPELDVLSGPVGAVKSSRWSRLALFVIGRPPLTVRERLEMPLQARAYIAAVFLLGLIAAVVTLVLDWGAPVERWWLLVVFSLLAIFDRALQLTFQGHTLRFEEGLLVAMALLFPPHVVLLVFLGSYLATIPTRRRISPWRSAFNLGLLAVSFSAALGVMALLGLEPGQAFDWRSLVAAVSGALTFFVLSTAAVSMVLALAESGHFRLRPPPDLTIYLSFFSSSVALGLLTGAVALAYPWALPLALVAAYNLLQALVSRTRAVRDREMLYGLLEATRRLQGAAAPDELEELALESARQLLRCQEAAIEDEPTTGPDRLSSRLPGEERYLSVAGRRSVDVFTVADQRLLDALAQLLHDEKARLELDSVRQERVVERLRADMVATVSHELRTPLTSIIGFTQFLLTHEVPAAERQRYLETISSESARLGALLNDFLDLQRIKEGHLTLVEEPIDLAVLVSEALKPFATQSDRHRFDVEGDAAVVLGDRARLHQVIVNLVSNAVKYSPQGGAIVIHTRRLDDRARVEVQDQGLGIPSTERENLFTKFFRVAGPERAEIGGTGLGLALCREIVVAHGGAIDFTSSEGQGSTFWFELPLSPPAVQA